MLMTDSLVMDINFAPPTRRRSPRQPRVLICPSGFKESLEPSEVADCIETGIRRTMPRSLVTKAPMVDGGEGFTKALTGWTNGEMRTVQVMGPVRKTISSHYGFLGGSRCTTAVIEMAAAAGLSVVPVDQRNPLYTTTYGVGELIKAALNDGAESILLGCGDSGTCDGGIGMAQALGARFFDSKGAVIPIAQGGASLFDLTSVDMSGLDERLKTVQIDVACNWKNVLCGPKGVARVFGPQKGASPAEVDHLSTAMDKVAQVVGEIVHEDVAQAPGSGASGGMGAGLKLIGAVLHPRFEVIGRFLDLHKLVSGSDVIITAEGGIDSQTPNGKIPAEVARIARSYNVPVIALAGTVGVGARSNYAAGIAAYASICSAPMTLAKAIQEAETLLVDAAENCMRMVMVGWTMNQSMSPQPAPRKAIELALRRSNTLQK